MLKKAKSRHCDIEYISCQSCQNQNENLDLIAEGTGLHAWNGKSRGDQTVWKRSIRKSQVPRELVANVCKCCKKNAKRYKVRFLNRRVEKAQPKEHLPGTKIGKRQRKIIRAVQQATLWQQKNTAPEGVLALRILRARFSKPAAGDAGHCSPWIP